MIPGTDNQVRATPAIRKAPSVMHIDAIGAAVAALLIAGVGFVAVRPVLAERREADARLVQLTAIESETSASLESLRATTRALNTARAETETLPVRLLSMTDRNSKIATVVAQAESFGMDVQSIRPGETVRGERYARTPLRISLGGSIASLARYLHELHELSTDLEITHLEIQAAAGVAVVDASIQADWITLTE